MSEPRLANRKPAILKMSIWLRLWFWWHKLTKKDVVIYPFSTIHNGIITFNYCFKNTHDVQFLFPMGPEEAEKLIRDLTYFVDLQKGLSK